MRILLMAVAVVALYAVAFNLPDRTPTCADRIAADREKMGPPDMVTETTSGNLRGVTMTWYSEGVSLTFVSGPGRPCRVTETRFTPAKSAATR